MATKYNDVLNSGKPLSQRVALAFGGALVMWLLLAYVPLARQVERGCSRVISWLLFPGHDVHEGEGTRADPFRIDKLQAPSRVVPPFVIGIKESEQTIFDAYPLSASDYAVLLQELHLNEVPRVMLGGNLAWTDADPFALDALEQLSGKFERCITSASVMRAATDAAVPAAFLRASVAVADVKGDVLSLPRVSQLAVPQTFLGQEKTWAGFSRIETLETNPTTTYIVARWGDRLIFSSTFLALLAQEQVELEELQICVGHSIQLPRSGKRIGLDVYGRASLDPVTLPAVDLQAEMLIRPEPVTLAKINQQHHIVHLLDQADGTPSEEQQRGLWTMAQAPLLQQSVLLARLPSWAEILLCAAFCLQLIMMGLMQALARFIAVALLLGLWLLAVRFGHTWIPLSPLCAAAFIVMMGGRARAVELLGDKNSIGLSHPQSGSWEIEFLPECTLINAPCERDHKDEAEAVPSAKNSPFFASEESKSEAAAYVVENAEQNCEKMIAPIASKAESVIEKKVFKKAGKKVTKKSAS
jgi:hypothetical protein